MSQNNFIKIHWKKPNYLVEERDMDSTNSTRLGTAKTLDKAIRIANKYIKENGCEYGLVIKLKRKV
jgi:hypothetical protein